MAKTTAKTVFVLSMQAHEPESRGDGALADIAKLCADAATRFDLTADCRVATDESVLIDLVHGAQAYCAAGIVINAGNHSAPSPALRAALAGSGIPAIEVHIGNRHAADSLCPQTFTAGSTLASLSGFGIEGYRLAISGLAAKIGATAIA